MSEPRILGLTGYWTGSFNGADYGGVSLGLEEKDGTIGGLATIHNHAAGTIQYSVYGRVGASIDLRLLPVSGSVNLIVGALEAKCAFDEDGALVGRWKSSQGTQGVFEARRYVDGPENSVEKPPRVNGFISYSHLDRSYLTELLVHLKPLERAGRTDIWSDERIKAGSLWKQEIESALARAHVAVLLISPDFLASDFIISNELPQLLARAEQNGVKILPVILRACRFTRDPILSVFQALNDPKQPLASLPSWERDVVYDRVALAIEEV